jgi:hypothetical protein
MPAVHAPFKGSESLKNDDGCGLGIAVDDAGIAVGVHRCRGGWSRTAGLRRHRELRETQRPALHPGLATPDRRLQDLPENSSARHEVGRTPG